MGAKDQNFLHTDSEDSDQTGRMPRLIRVFAGRTMSCHFVGFVMRRLKCESTVMIKNISVVGVLLLYHPSTLFMSFWMWSVNLSTLFLGKPPRQGESGRRNNFMTNLHERIFCQSGGSNLWKCEYQADMHPTQLPGPAILKGLTFSFLDFSAGPLGVMLATTTGVSPRFEPIPPAILRPSEPEVSCCSSTVLMWLMSSLPSEKSKQKQLL